MVKLCIFAGSAILGWVGWWLGEQVDSSMTAALVLSGIGSLAGAYLGWRLARALE